MKCHGETVVIYMYTKTTNNTHHDQFLPHQLPGILSQYLDRYLILIRPMETILSGMLFGSDASALYQEYLMVKLNRKVESAEFCQNFQHFTKTYFGQQINISTWRHIAVAIKREFIPEFFYRHFTGGSDIGDYQGGHSSSTAKRLYGVNTKGIPYLNTQVLYYCSQFSRQWHNVMGVGKQAAIPLFKRVPYEHTTTLYTTESPMTDRETLARPLGPESVSSSSSKEEMRALLDLFQAQIQMHFAGALNTMRAQMEKCINDGIVRGLQLCGNLQQNTPQMSLKEGLGLELNGPAVSFDSSLAWGSDSEPSGSVEALDNMDTDDATMLTNMCLAYGEPEGSMKWKSDGQRKLLEGTKRKGQNLVGCIPTGGGKSASFEVPAFTDARGQVTVVVGPFRALVNQIISGFRRRNVTCNEWKSKESNLRPPPSVIVIISDLCGDTEFIGYVRFICSRGEKGGLKACWQVPEVH